MINSGLWQYTYFLNTKGNIISHSFLAGGLNMEAASFGSLTSLGAGVTETFSSTLQIDTHSISLPLRTWPHTDMKLYLSLDDSLDVNDGDVQVCVMSVLETPGIPVTGTPSIHSPCHEELF